ncbi:hypothetical protein Pmani_029238 [Petrolisthes manimaculis]|uniref:Uncharacterized protein n=1 Tax=Petrolisthes manimaculis TaxID=1843537 RepID=A0AAE1TX60_9EUCA|nr:hypothetical protein Pmani_029238 [Petrolisthes manimaculis]
MREGGERGEKRGKRGKERERRREEEEKREGRRRVEEEKGKEEEKRRGEKRGKGGKERERRKREERRAEAMEGSLGVKNIGFSSHNRVRVSEYCIECRCNSFKVLPVSEDSLSQMKLGSVNSPSLETSFRYLTTRLK